MGEKTRCRHNILVEDKRSVAYFDVGVYAEVSDNAYIGTTSIYQAFSIGFDFIPSSDSHADILQIQENIRVFNYNTGFRVYFQTGYFAFPTLMITGHHYRIDFAYAQATGLSCTLQDITAGTTATLVRAQNYTMNYHRLGGSNTNTVGFWMWNYDAVFPIYNYHAPLSTDLSWTGNIHNARTLVNHGVTFEEKVLSSSTVDAVAWTTSRTTSKNSTSGAYLRANANIQFLKDRGATITMHFDAETRPTTEWRCFFEQATHNSVGQRYGFWFNYDKINPYVFADASLPSPWVFDEFVTVSLNEPHTIVFCFKDGKQEVFVDDMDTPALSRTNAIPDINFRGPIMVAGRSDGYPSHAELWEVSYVDHYCDAGQRKAIVNGTFTGLDVEYHYPLEGNGLDTSGKERHLVNKNAVDLSNIYTEPNGKGIYSGAFRQGWASTGAVPHYSQIGNEALFTSGDHLVFADSKNFSIDTSKDAFTIEFYMKVTNVADGTIYPILHDFLHIANHGTTPYFEMFGTTFGDADFVGGNFMCPAYSPTLVAGRWYRFRVWREESNPYVQATMVGENALEVNFQSFGTMPTSGTQIINAMDSSNFGDHSVFNLHFGNLTEEEGFVCSFNGSLTIASNPTGYSWVNNGVTTAGSHNFMSKAAQPAHAYSPRMDHLDTYAPIDATVVSKAPALKEGHNLAPVVTTFPPEVTRMVRTDTTIWKAAATSGPTFDTGNPSGWTGADLVRSNILSWLQPAVSRTIFEKYEGSTGTQEARFKTLLIYLTQKTVAEALEVTAKVNKKKFKEV